MSSIEELWRESVKWIINCKILPKDHKVNGDDSNIHYFAKILRDGVLLCRLVNFLDIENEPVDFHQRPRDAEFLCTQNIIIFLSKCKNHFKMPESDLFTPEMLFE